MFRFIRETYKRKNGVNCPDLDKLASALAQFLLGCDWETVDICSCVTNRFDSEKPPAEAPHRWLSQLATYKTAPLNAFNNLKAGAVPNSKRVYVRRRIANPNYLRSE